MKRGAIMIGERIKNLRLNLGYKQEELAEKLSISRSSLSLYEIDKRDPDSVTSIKIADFFNVSLDYLNGRTDEPTPIYDVKQELNDELDTESKWLNFLKNLSGDSMFYQYENIDEEQKMAIMEEYKEKLEKKKKKVEKFMDYSDEVIDEALTFAAYNQEQRKKKGDI